MLLFTLIRESLSLRVNCCSMLAASSLWSVCGPSSHCGSLDTWTLSCCLRRGPGSTSYSHTLLLRGSTHLWFAYILATWWVQRSSLGSVTCVRVSMRVWVHAWQSACDFSRRQKRQSDLENANSSPPLSFFRGLTASEGGKKPHKASLTKLHFLSPPLLSSSPLPAQPHWSHSLCLLVCGETDFVG